MSPLVPEDPDYKAECALCSQAFGDHSFGDNRCPTSRPRVFSPKYRFLARKELKWLGYPKAVQVGLLPGGKS